MYIGTIKTTGHPEVFDSVGELVEYYNKHHKGDHYVEIHEAIKDSSGCVQYGEFMFGFHTENFGDIH